jgi:hypothetical protein
VGDRTNVGNRANVGDRTNISGDRTRVGDVNINAGNKVAVNRKNNINATRNRWANVNNRPFDRNWWGRQNFSGVSRNWYGGWSKYPKNWCWRPATWAACGTWFAWSVAKPYNYDYGNTVVYRDNYVYVNDKQFATAEAYYEQADTIAQAIPEDVEPENVEWMPLGVFALADESGTDNGMVVQLAVSKEGIVAGTFYNDATSTGRPVEGMVDQKSQRVAWKFADGKNSDVVMETGIYNLTQDEATAQVHFGADESQTWLMVRLPEEDAAG